MGCPNVGRDILDFGPNIETKAPSATDVKRCRAEMYLQSDVEIIPEGYKLISGIDDAIWFRFIAKTTNIADVFMKDKVNTSKFTTNHKFYGDTLPDWWDIESKVLTGGEISLPNARFMNVGYVNNQDGTLTVYVIWHET
ncbi:MAG: hypothetical protein WCD18_27815 [Thermosynechococcaceae cyanobacterium]